MAARYEDVMKGQRWCNEWPVPGMQKWKLEMMGILFAVDLVCRRAINITANCYFDKRGRLSRR